MKWRVGTIKSDKSSKSGIFVCGHFDPNKHRLDFTIAYADIGIRENVRRHLGKTKMSSCKAIQRALEEGHSTRISSQSFHLIVIYVKAGDYLSYSFA